MELKVLLILAFAKAMFIHVARPTVEGRMSFLRDCTHRQGNDQPTVFHFLPVKLETAAVLVSTDKEAVPTASTSAAGVGGGVQQKMGASFRQAMVRCQGWEIHEGHEGARRVGNGVAEGTDGRSQLSGL